MTFDVEIQPRYRDINLGGHVDNVEAIRLLDEARIRFLRFADGGSETGTGVLGRAPHGVAELVGSQRVEYRTEMRFVSFQPFLVRLWVTRIGTTSFGVASELRTAPDHDPAVVAVTGLVLWDHRSQTPWTIDDDVRADLTPHLGETPELRA